MILTAGEGANKRQWELNDEEFERFEIMFEENELIDISKIDFSKIKLIQVDAPERK